MTAAKFSPSNASRSQSHAERVGVDGIVFGKNRLLWIGVIAVLVPLLVLLVLQYRWLIDLERNSAVARRAALENYLVVVAAEVRFFFTSTAERALDLPPAAFSEKTIQKATHVFESKNVDGVDRFFVITYQPIPTLYFFDPDSRAMIQPDPSPETQAVWVSVAPWNTLHKTLTEVANTEFSVNEHDPDHRIILKPITDESNFLVAVAGIVIDQSYFTETVLPGIVAKSLPNFDQKDALWICVRDRDDNRVYPPNPCSPYEQHRLQRPLEFAFTDWTLTLQGTLAVPERWARTNFNINVTLSAALAVVLMGGIVFTVRTAIREVRLSAMKNEFVSNVSHELRTPLASIRVFGELMRRGRVQDSAKVKEYGTHIEVESRRLSQLINNILDFSRIESGEKIYAFEPTDLEEVLAGTLASYGVRVRDRGIELEYEGPEDPPPELLVDGAAIDRAIANLLDNAVKYSKDGNVITVRLAEDEEDVVLSVADRGIGIPLDEHEQIFDRFHRVGTGLVHDVKGSGLGLALVQSIVHAHGGRVTLTSEVGKGSTFSIHLPKEWAPNTTERGRHGQGSHR